MSHLSYPTHGGDLGFATAKYGEPEGGWLDLSTGINPHPYPAPAIDASILTRLPDRRDLDTMLALARRAYGAPDFVGLVAAPGSEIAIRLLPFLLPKGTVAIVGPTYGSHGAAWRNAGRNVVDVQILEAAAIVVVGNPNNPDGRRYRPEALADVARQLGERGGILVVDEAFADVAPDIGLMPHLADLPALVLRSFGKFYGLPGLRLGFVAGPLAITDRLANLVGDWPVSGPATMIASAALADGTWSAGMRAQLASEAGQLRDLLMQHRLTITGGTDLFILVDDGNASTIHHRLAERGIWTRIFAEQPNWLRVGLPSDFARLERALQAIR